MRCTRSPSIRRALLLAAGATAGFAYIGASPGQSQAKVPRVGFLSGRGAPTAGDPDPNANAFREELRALGRIDGQNIHIEYRYVGGNPGRSPELIAELVQLRVDVIVTPYGAAIRAAKAATKTIPIVMVTVQDPVAAGYVASLARPGGNITGVTRLTLDLSAKRLEMLKELFPGLTRVGVLYSQEPSSPYRPEPYEDAARALKIQMALLPVDAQNPNLSGAIQSALDARVSALIVARSPLFLSYQKQLFDLISKSRLPSICEGAEEAAAGGLLSYASNDADGFRRAAVYVDKILKGAKPGDLPVEQPTTFELIVNMRTAKALGITIPQTILIRVDRVIE